MRIVVIGSGPSGVHFALTALRRGHEVTLIDGGRPAPAPVLPDAGFDDLKNHLADPAGYFLGEAFEGVVLPSAHKEYYGIPPHRQYLFETPPGYGWTATGFEPLVSFAQGGLAEAWTAGCYPFNDDELEAFPFGYAELAPHYEEVTRRIGIAGERDDLARFIPVHDHLHTPPALDAHSAALLRAYGRRRRGVNAMGCFVGRTRVATLTEDRDGRGGCAYLGRCLYGCPKDALWVPTITLRECAGFRTFRHETGWLVRHFELDDAGAIRAVVARPRDGGEARAFSGDRYVLAAGTLSSTRIVLETVARRTGTSPRVTGLMDNRQILVPFLNLGMLGRRFDPATYQYHLLGLGIEGSAPAEYVHGQVTTLKTALMHPIIQALPLSVTAATAVARACHAALGVVNLNFHDTRRPDNDLTVTAGGTGEPVLAIRYRPEEGEPARVARAMKILARALRRLGCIVPPGMAHVRPMGASVHYAGTLPMRATSGPWTTDAQCRSRDLPNLWIVDGSTFPFLPAKNVTFTLMANAVRVANAAF